MQNQSHILALVQNIDNKDLKFKIGDIVKIKSMKIFLQKFTLQFGLKKIL